MAPKASSTVSERTAVVMPAFNAARHLDKVIEGVSKHIDKDRIIVIDDGSADSTSETAEASGARVLKHEVNRGKGAALATGISEAVRLGLEYVITMDADGQHDPDEIPIFLEHEAHTGAEVIVGNRMADRKDMPAIRVFANRFTSAFVSFKTGQSIPDSQNGYRLFKTAIFAGIHLETERYDTESEILIKAAGNGARIDWVPVETIYGSEKSTVHPVVDTFRFFRVVFKSLFW